MKINGIKALDYQCQGDSLTLVLADTDFETVSNLDTALIEVRTDDGDLVEAHGGYALRNSTTKDKQTENILAGYSPFFRSGANCKHHGVLCSSGFRLVSV